MTRQQAIAHNKKVVKNIIDVLFEFKMIDPFKMVTDRDYVRDSINSYLVAANITRETLGMPKIKLYSTDEVDDE